MIKKILSKIPSYSDELNLNLAKAEDRFKWLLASILFAKRISSEIAKKTFQKFIENGLTSPDSLLKAGWDKIVEVLDAGGYVRYDFSTATNILETVKLLKKQYRGSLENLYENASNSKDLERRLREFKGVGPVAVNIFLRELRKVWDKAKPEISSIALNMAKQLKLDKQDAELYESKLIRIFLQYCKKRRCKECPVKEYCEKCDLSKHKKPSY
ncbi:hypothetical protein DRO51_01700 [Candidatus Bathyarchaeota archaeon]|nr:MAG: hypothetical protein DRO51_01700 [Candidatus Bathyarchaeota archaeon]